MKTRDEKEKTWAFFSSKTSSAWCWSAVEDMLGVRRRGAPRVSLSALTRVCMARVSDRTRVTVSKVLEERIAQNVRMTVIVRIILHNTSRNIIE